MMIRKPLAVGIAAGIVVLAAAFMAGAQAYPPAAGNANNNANTNNSGTGAANSSSASVMTGRGAAEQEILRAGPTGQVLARGMLASKSNNSITLDTWGGPWIINIGPNTRIFSGTNTVRSASDTSQFQSGDFVGVAGTVLQNASWTIDATIVRDHSR